MDDQLFDFEKLRQTYKVDEEYLPLYLKEIFKDLSLRDSTHKSLITKVTFYDYIKIPILIQEKLFKCMDKDNDGFLNQKEFTLGMMRVYAGSFEETTKFIFELYDFDNDGKINPGDVKVILCYLPLIEKNNAEFKNQMDSLLDIDEILKSTFENEKELSYDQFLRIVEKKTSDIFLQLICYLYEMRPFTKKNVSVFRSKKIPDDSINKSDSPMKKIVSPSKKSFLSPCFNFIQLSLDNQLSDNLIDQTYRTPEKLGIDGMIRMNNTMSVKGASRAIIEELQKENKTLESPSVFLKRSSNEITPFSLESTLVKMDDKDQKETQENNNFPLKKSISLNFNLNNIISFESLIYKCNEKNEMKMYYLSLVGKEIYYYKNAKKEEVIGMHNLAGCFVVQNDDAILNNKRFSTFSIIFNSKISKYYALDKKLVEQWISKLKQAIGYLNFFDFYEMTTRDIGEGKFGLVKLGLHKKTKGKVAIKIIKKEKMDESDIELVRSEIDIMKLCKHPNVVRLLDHFENAQYIFIVMEYLEGGDYGAYLKKQKGKITEQKLARDIFQIASGLKYLHQYGIIHRDLKPDNIMLSKNSDNYVLKIMDFGLSKILGPQERALDGFGTLSFVAPEILVRDPYGKQVDIWSLGIIMYFALSGVLPFDDENDNDEIIAKMVVFNEVTFPSNLWKERSKLSTKLIQALLTKNPVNRINVDQLLNDEWVLKYNQD